MEIFIGIIGAITALSAFILNQFGILKATSFRYDLLNTVGSAFLITYAILTEAYPFIILNTVWGLVSLVDVVKAIKKA